MSTQRQYKVQDTKSFHTEVYKFNTDDDQFNTDWDQVKTASLPKNVKIRPIEDILASLNEEDFEDTLRGPKTGRFKAGDRTNTFKPYKRGFDGR